VWVEEGLFKAIVFGLPVVWLVRKEGLGWRDLGISGDNFFVSVYLGLALGVVLGLVGQVGNVMRYGILQIQSQGLTSEMLGGFLILSLVTAFWEQLVFAGYLLHSLSRVIRDEQLLVVVVGSGFALLHLPTLVVQQLDWGQIALAVGLLLVLGTGSAILRLRQKNLIAAVMAHALWGVAIFLFR
jgi:membrane protease YdiL (CAAX protease family)